MKRRSLIEALAMCGIGSLTGCGGGSSGGGGGSVACRSGTFALGLNPASADVLAGIPTLGQAAIGAGVVAAGAASSAPGTPSYFNLSDSADLARYGWSPAILPSPGDQGRLGSCVAWGVGYAMTSFHRAVSTATQARTPETIASPQDLYAKILQREAGNICGNGTLIRDAMNVLVDEGVASLATRPYSDAACSAPVRSQAFLADGYNQIAVGDRNAIRFALSQFHVLPFGMTVYADFMELRGSQVYSRGTDASCPLGGHCMALIGFDDSRRAYRVINSWTQSWGDNGYCWMAYETFERIASEVYVPYFQGTRARSTFVQTASSRSGSISTLASYALTPINASGRFDRAISTFRLNDAIAATSYSVFYVPNVGNTITLGSRVIRQVLRGSIIEMGIADDSVLRTPGHFVTRLQGVSRLGEQISVDIYSKYPDPGGR